MVAILRQKQIAPRSLAFSGLGRRAHRRHQFDLPVERNRLAMHAPNEGVPPPANHGVTQPTQRSFLVHGAPRPRSAALRETPGTGSAGPLVLPPVGGGRLHEVSQPGGELRKANRGNRSSFALSFVISTEGMIVFAGSFSPLSRASAVSLIAS